MGFDQSFHNWPSAPEWALFVGPLGRTLILLGLLAFAVSAISWLTAKSRPSRGSLGGWAFVIGVVCLFGALVCLGSLFVGNQFEYNYVFAHGDAGTELRYKIAGIWSGQQGSFLLWACTSSLFGALAARTTGPYRRWFSVVFAAFLACLCGILAYETPFEIVKLDPQMLAVFGNRIPVPPQGAGLTPSLQNYWVVIHPPTIFMGFGSLTVAFAMGLAAMLTGNVTDWAAILRPWALVSTAVLGLGLSMGGFWAYETLGWGGFWMWDPVENVSFVPWLFSIALVHGFFIQAAKKRFIGANLFMAGMPFVLFCYGTFLTRSGFLDGASVHSFAEMNHNALWILAGIVVLSALIYYTVYAIRGLKLARAATPDPSPEPGLNRESLYTSGILLLSGLSAAIAVGMSVPFFMALAHRNSKVVEEGLYHKVVVWFFIPILILMGTAPFIGWRKLSLGEVLGRLLNVLALSIGALGLFVMMIKLGWLGITPDPGPAGALSTPGDSIPPILGVPAWLVLTGLLLSTGVATLMFVRRKRLGKQGAIGWILPGCASLSAVTGLYIAGVELHAIGTVVGAGEIVDVASPGPPPPPPAISFPFHLWVSPFWWLILLVGVCAFGFFANFWRLAEMFKRSKSLGGFVAHIGIAILFAGLIISRGFERKERLLVQEGDSATTASGYTVTYQGMTGDDLLDRNNKVLFEVKGPDGEFTARPGLYYFQGDQGKPTAMVWPHIDHSLTHDIYFTLYPPQTDVWDSAIPFAAGQTIRPGNGPIEVSYNGYKMVGKPGAVGTEFVADTVVRVQNDDGVWHATKANPNITITSDGIQHTDADVDQNFVLSLESLNAADHSATLQMRFARPIYGIDLFFKPLVVMVWIGAGVTALGGLLAALARRPARARRPIVVSAQDSVEAEEDVA